MSKTELIQKYSSLFWYFDKSKIEDISDDVLVEFILNYGDLEAVRELFKTLEINKVAQIFKNKAYSERSNYFPQVKNYFNLVFQKHVPEYTL